MQELAVGRPSAQARLEAITLVRLDGAVAYVRPVSPAHASRLRAGISWVQERLSEAAGRTIRVRVEEAGEADDGPAPASETPEIDEGRLRREAEGNDLVRAAMDLFQARLIRIDDAPRAGDHDPPQGGTT